MNLDRLRLLKWLASSGKESRAVLDFLGEPNNRGTLANSLFEITAGKVRKAKHS